MTRSEPTTSLTDDEVRVVDRLRPAASALFRRFDADLQRQQRLSHSDYMVLLFLCQAPDQTLGLSELAARCQQSLSAISRTIGRLKADGLVRREQSPHDARAYNAVLTDAGLARVQRAMPIHHESVRHYLLGQLQGIDLRALGIALERIAADRLPATSAAIRHPGSSTS
jgi:DNA-binding MarR family transcriptional regulator